MPNFEIMMPSGKTVDLTEKVKAAKSEKDIKTALAEALKTEKPKAGAR